MCCLRFRCLALTTDLCHFVLSKNKITIQLHIGIFQIIQDFRKKHHLKMMSHHNATTSIWINSLPSILLSVITGILICQMRKHRNKKQCSNFSKTYYNITTGMPSQPVPSTADTSFSELLSNENLATCSTTSSASSKEKGECCRSFILYSIPALHITFLTHNNLPSMKNFCCPAQRRACCQQQQT